jgi:hypothetical protein
MGNCLVTKLKGVVDNDNLPIFDKIQVKFLKNVSENANLRFNVGMKAGETSTITSKAGTLLDFTTKQGIPSKTCRNFDAAGATTTSTEGDILYADNMYNISTFYLGTSVGTPSANLVEFEVNQLRYLSLYRLHLAGCFVNKQFNDLSFLDGSIETLEIISINGNGTHLEDVDLMYLTKFIYLRQIDSSGTLYKPVDYKQFALGQIANGRTTGTINLTISSNNLFDGASILPGSYGLSWTSADNITLSPQ